jgi:type I restriction enzyme S subunit
MNAERLLAHFERIGEAPDAIARLRRFILDLAVRGKLVEQDPEDEPAEELLKRIAVEKVRLVKTGEMKRGKVLPPIEEDKLSFDLPSAWAFTRLGDLIHLVSGQHLQPHEYTENSWDGLPYITGPSDFADEGLRISRFALVRKAVAKKGQLLLTVKGSGVGKATTCNLPEVAISRQLMALMAIGWDDRFLILIANRLAVQLRNAARSLIPGISREDVEEFAFPLPPLVEQHRIVAKVDELMALCDQLEAARNQREQGRDRLVAATLQRLNQPAENLESFRKDASFTLQVLPSLTANTAQIKQLRQTILNLAVRGKLVEQDPEDEPAEELVERILSHPWLKKRAKPQPAFADKAKTVMRIPVPDSWTWTTIESLLPPNETVTYGILKPVWVESGVPTVRVTEMKTGAIDVDRLPRCDQSRADKFQKTTLKEGDLLISKDGTIGKTAFVPAALTGGNITQHVLRLPLSTLLSKEYIRFSIDSPWCQTYMSGETKGVALQGVNVGDFRKMPIPLPPLAEQHRIVAKVDELMALCDQLEQQLSQADQQRRRLLEAVLAEALVGRLTTEQKESHAAIA